MFETWRRKVVESRIFGRVLNVGCGKVLLKIGIGIDLLRYHKYSSSFVCNDATILAFKNENFDTVCMVAFVNYIDSFKLGKAIQEGHRVLTKYGRLIITCTTPFGGFVHRLLRWKQPRGMSVKAVRTLVEANGFRLVYDKPFMLWLNHLYVFGKEIVPTENLVQIQKVIKEEIHHHE